jgi:hypothetical protein
MNKNNRVYGLKIKKLTSNLSSLLVERTESFRYWRLIEEKAKKGNQ